MKEKVFVLLYPGCISFEVALAAELLSRKFEIVTATPNGQDLESSSGLPLRVQISFADVNLDSGRAVLVPGGNPDSIAHNLDIDRILQQADQRSLVIGAICAGPSMLGKAGILKGKRIAHGYGPEQLGYLKDIFQGVTLTEEMYVADGNILTAKPQAHIEFAVEMAVRLGAVSAEKASRLKDYYRGVQNE